MDEKKQIEEMAELIVKSKQCRGDCNKCKYIDDIATVCTSKRVAEEILKRYQPKIPEGAVVLTREEHEELKRYKTEWLNNEKMHLQAELEDTEFELSCVNSAYKALCEMYDEAKMKERKYNEFNHNLVVENQNLKDKLELKGKETAREILQTIKSYDGWNELQRLRDDIAEQYGVEVDDEKI